MGNDHLRKFINYLTIICFILFCSFINNKKGIAADEVNMSQEEMNSILQKINELENRIHNIKINEKLEDTTTDIENDIENIESEIEEVSDILQVVEKKSFVDAIELGAEILTRFDWFTFDGHDFFSFSEEQKGDILHERVRMLPSNRLRINLVSKITNKLNFHSRLVMYKNWADDDYPVFPISNFLNKSRIPSDIHLNVERAYVDYFFKIFDKYQMAFTFGRLPTTDGFPTNFREDTVRKSTYPSLAYDVEADGFGLTIDLNKITFFPKSSLRLVYLRRYDDNEQYRSGNRLTYKEGKFRIDENAESTYSVYIAQLETGLGNLISDSLFIINLNYMPKAPSQDFRDDDRLYPFYYDDTKIIYVDSPDSLAQGCKLTLFLESQNILNSGIDFFAGYGKTKTFGEGSIKFMFNPKPLGLPGEPVLARYAYSKYKTLIDNFPTFEPLLKDLQSAPPPIGILNYGDSDTEGEAFHVGMRFTFPFKILHNLKFGIEYNRGSRYWLGFSNGSEDPLKKLTTRGKVWDMYLIQPINKYLKIRAGFTLTKQEFDQGLGFYFGEPLSIDHDVNNSYFLIDARF